MLLQPLTTLFGKLFGKPHLSFPHQSATNPSHRGVMGAPCVAPAAVGACPMAEGRRWLECDREKFLLLAESSTDVIAFLSSDLSECYVNPAGKRLLRSEMQTESHPEALFRLIGSPREQVLERLENGHQRNVVIETEEGPCTLQVRVFVVQPDAAGEPLGLAIVGRDVSKEQRYKEELEKAVRARDEFLAMVSHDLRNPMNVILGWVQILRNNTVSQEQLNRILSSLEKNARLQDNLISDLLDVSRLVNGKMMFRPARMHLSELLLNVCESARLTAEQKNIRLVTNLPSEDITLHADSERLHQVVWNLLSNALKFTPEEGEVCVEARASTHEVSIVVRDTGCGMDPELLASVFDRFWQSGPLGARKGGLGLGLSIVKGIVELHGGKVEALSEGRGHGCSFVVTLPRRSLLRVLVVDDSAEIKDLFTSMLQALGADVDSASTAREGLSKALAKDFNLLLCDLELPKEDGFWLVQKIREFERKLGSEPVRIVACSAKCTVKRSELSTLGFDDFLPKPVSLADFERMLRECAGRKPVQGGQKGPREWMALAGPAICASERLPSSLKSGAE